MDGTLIDQDILVIGAGPGGLLAALSAKRHGKAGCRVTLVDAATVGRAGHGAFSNAWTIIVLPDDDLEATAREIVVENDWLADQELVHDVLATSHERLRDLEAAGLDFARDAAGSYVRRPTRGLRHARVMHPEGGGLEFCWKMRQAIEAAGVRIIDRVFVTGLLKSSSDAVTGAIGIHSRTGEFHVLRARSTIVATNAISFRSGFVRDLTGTGTLLAYKAGATLRNAEQSYLRPGTPKFYFEGITFAIQEGARFVNARDEQFMNSYEPDWGDRADVPRIARAMAIEHQKGNTPIYLDMSKVPLEKREYFIRSKVAWMDLFFQKLGPRAKIDMFGKTPYYPQNQMTKMAIRTDSACRSDVPGLLAAGLAQAGCANHFAGFHFGMCIGSGWVAGRSAVEDLDTRRMPELDAAEIAAFRRDSSETIDPDAEHRSGILLRRIQNLMFRYDISVWKHRQRLDGAIAELAEITDAFTDMQAAHTHELVRLQETQAMLLAADIILRASRFREESRMNHFREDFPVRDPAWHCWVDVHENSGPRLERTPIPHPLYRPDETDADVAAGAITDTAGSSGGEPQHHVH